MFSKFINWLVLSSENPTQASSTIKGILGAGVAVLIAISPLLHLSIGGDQLNMIVDSVVGIFTALLGVVSAITFIFGLVRKLKNTFQK